MNKKGGMSIWILIIILVVIGIGIYFWVTGESTAPMPDRAEPDSNTYILDDLLGFTLNNINIEKRDTHTYYEAFYTAEKTKTEADANVLVFKSSREAKAHLTKGVGEMGEFIEERVGNIDVFATPIISSRRAPRRIFAWASGNKVIIIEEYPTDDDLFEAYFNKYH